MPAQRLHCIYKMYVDSLSTEAGQQAMAGEEMQEQLEDAGLNLGM